MLESRVYNLVSSRSLKFIKNAKNNLNTLVKRVFSEDLAYSFSGHNIFCGRTYMKEYSTDDVEMCCSTEQISCCHQALLTFVREALLLTYVKDNCY